MKPVIGLVADTDRRGAQVLHTVQQKYLEAVTAGAAAIAVVLPARIDAEGGAWTDPDDFGRILDRLDGLVLTGAVSNIEPRQYGRAAAAGGSPADPWRDAVALPLGRMAVARGLPVLGICRGLQELNVALGGTLHQAVHAAGPYADHREPESAPLAEKYAPRHEVRLTAGGLLARLAGADTARVNSLHGQGIDELAPGAAVEAVAPDGLVEAFRIPGPRFALAVQWHPEWEFRTDPLSRALFRALGEAARDHAAARAAPAARVPA
jgi:putative glutamine amidotransferase